MKKSDSSSASPSKTRDGPGQKRQPDGDGWIGQASVGAGPAAASRMIPPEELDLDLTLGCGQAFRWKPVPGGWEAVVSGRLVRLERYGDLVSAIMRPGPFDGALLNHYLDSGLSLRQVRREIGVDEHIRAALAAYPGLRILQQEPWETLIAFILSQWSNVPRIAGQMEALSRRYGAEVAPGAFAFPSPENLCRATAQDLKEIGLGYRVEYVLRAARRCAEDGVDWLSDLARLPYQEARDRMVLPPSPKRTVVGVHGVGPKVADCILLFSLGHYEAFPVDLHVRRAMERWYGEQAVFTPGYDSVARFGREHFGRYGGYAQQYLFHRQRTATS